MTGTDVEPAQAATPAVPDDELGLGLEDFDTSDMVMPRLSIVHPTRDDPTPYFEDNLTKERYESLDVIILGLVKQRILWPPEMGDGEDGPLCKSADFETGIPNPKTFPWQESGFAKQDGDIGSVTLDCSACPLKEWGSNPKADTPWCSEQYTFAVLVPGKEEGEYSPAILTFQRSGIKPCKTYLTAFAKSKTPLFTCRTTIGLEARKRGNVHFAVPQFVKGPETPSELWPEFGTQYRSIREFLQSVRIEEPKAAGSDDEGEAPEPTGTSTAEAATAAADAEDDLPF